MTASSSPGMALRQPELGEVPIVYDKPGRKDPPQLQARDLEIMRALWRHDYLTTSQIGFAWWDGNHPSRAQIRLAELSGARLLARFRPLIRRGRHQWIYQLARDGFRAAQQRARTAGAYIDPQARWTDHWAVDMRLVEHQLRTNGWILAYRSLLGGRAVDWLGRREAHLVLEAGGPAGVAPDAELLIELDPRSAPLELLVELVRDERPIRLVERLRRYGAFLGGGWSELAPPRRPAGPPAAALVCPGYREVEQLIRAADAELAEPSDARQRLLFCAEPDVHAGLFRAWMLPPEPPRSRPSESFRAREVRLPGET